MKQRVTNLLRLSRALVWAGLILGAVAAGWLTWQTRQSGRAMEELLGTSWPRGDSAPVGMRERLLAAAESLGHSDFGRFATALGPTRPLSGEEEAAAERFLRQIQRSRRRLIAAATTAAAAQRDGTDVRAVREALARALLAAAHRDPSGVERELDIAEAALAAAELEAPAAAGAADQNSVAALLAQLAPGFELAHELMTEGYAAAEKVLARASWQLRAGEFREALGLVSLAGRLLAIEPTVTTSATIPAWFEQLARRPSGDVSAPEATAVVELCAKMAAAETLTGALRQVVQRAEHRLQAGQFAEAHWWATVALAGLGMNEEEIAAVARHR